MKIQILGKRVKHTTENRHAWIRDLKSGEINYNRPVVLCLPGDDTQTEVNSDGSIDDAKATKKLENEISQENTGLIEKAKQTMDI